jgi:PTH1 family peptidyl-tRNA hydrolase
MKIIVGLGNPGEKYKNTRHNLGFVFVDKLASKLDPKEKFVLNSKIKAEILETNVNQEKVIMIKPQTFMNSSGIAVKLAINYFNCETENLIVVSDDTNLNIGQARIRFGGEAGGHNGLKSVINAVGENFWRVRLGVGAPAPKIALEDYVLAQLHENDQTKMADIVDKTANELIESIIRNKIENKTIS